MFTGVGVYISRVEEGSVAERAGLRPGDTILEVNGTPFRAVTHEEALKVTLFFLLKYFLALPCYYQFFILKFPIHFFLYLIFFVDERVWKNNILFKNSISFNTIHSFNDVLKDKFEYIFIETIEEAIIQH